MFSDCYTSMLIVLSCYSIHKFSLDLFIARFDVYLCDKMVMTDSGQFRGSDFIPIVRLRSSNYTLSIGGFCLN